jgi:chromosome partitioning protein
MAQEIKNTEASLYQQTICEYLPKNIAAVAYEKFVEEVLENEHSKEKTGTD